MSVDAFARAGVYECCMCECICLPFCFTVDLSVYLPVSWSPVDSSFFCSSVIYVEDCVFYINSLPICRSVCRSEVMSVYRYICVSARLSEYVCLSDDHPLSLHLRLRVLISVYMIILFGGSYSSEKQKYQLTVYLGDRPICRGEHLA